MSCFFSQYYKINLKKRLLDYETAAMFLESKQLGEIHLIKRIGEAVLERKNQQMHCKALRIGFLI